MAGGLTGGRSGSLPGLPLDARPAHRWGEIDAARQRSGRPLSVPDGQIAATALEHGLHLMTRHTRDFEETGALTIDPWE